MDVFNLVNMAFSVRQPGKASRVQNCDPSPVAFHYSDTIMKKASESRW